LSSLQEAGVDASPRRTKNVTFSITAKSFEERQKVVHDVLKRAEEESRI
jgi:hypothetical protein